MAQHLYTLRGISQKNTQEGRKLTFDFDSQGETPIPITVEFPQTGQLPGGISIVDLLNQVIMLGTTMAVTMPDPTQ